MGIALLHHTSSQHQSVSTVIAKTTTQAPDIFTRWKKWSINGMQYSLHLTQMCNLVGCCQQDDRVLRVWSWAIFFVFVCIKTVSWLVFWCKKMMRLLPWKVLGIRYRHIRREKTRNSVLGSRAQPLSRSLTNHSPELFIIMSYYIEELTYFNRVLHGSMKKTQDWTAYAVCYRRRARSNVSLVVNKKGFVVGDEAWGSSKISKAINLAQ